MEWQGEAVLLSVRPLGESGAVIEVLTPEHGRHAGLVRGGAGRRMAAVLQPGAQLSVVWRGRLESHLGSFAVEPLRGRAGLILGDRAALAGLQALCALAVFALPERAPDAEFYAQTVTVLDLLGQSTHWPYAYLLWELSLLERSGFGLDLAACAVSGARRGLAYVSPRTGRAVTAAAAGAWADRLLPLPPCLTGTPPQTRAELLAGLQVTGHFLDRRLAQAQGRALPPARARLIAALGRGGTLSPADGGR